MTGQQVAAPRRAAQFEGATSLVFEDDARENDMASLCQEPWDAIWDMLIDRDCLNERIETDAAEGRHSL